MAHQKSSHELAIPNSNQKVKVEVALVPADELPDTFHKNTNVAKVNVGGKDFFAVVGKTN
jgi:hypothetical protein